jgi:endonuclease YncB( thermonuclease family)
LRLFIRLPLTAHRLLNCLLGPTTDPLNGRTVAFVRAENVSVNEELIKGGLAWVYLRYCRLPLWAEWQSLELAAQAEK